MLPLVLASESSVTLNLNSIVLGVERISWVVVSYLIANTIAAGLWTAGGLIRPAADDLHGARAVHGRLGAVRAVAQRRISDSRARIARPWRPRPDDAIASAGRRDNSAARARALSGLSGGRVGSVEHIRPGRRRISHAGLRLAIDFSGQCAARPCRRGDGAAAQDQTRRLAQNEFRCARVGAVHVVRQPGHPGARAGATHGRRHLAPDRGPARVRSARAAGADLAGEAFNLAAHSAYSASLRSGAPMP